MNNNNIKNKNIRPNIKEYIIEESDGSYKCSLCGKIIK